MYLWGFGCLLRLALLFGTTNSLDMALFFTAVADLFLVKTIMCRMCVSTTAVANGGGRRFRWCWFVVFSQFVNVKDWVGVELT